jgi:iron only hydrogenase large subunit-like protein
MFSSIVKLADLDDIFSPAQACVKPLIQPAGNNKEKAKISLADCLACAGCVTSSEAVWIEQQSHLALVQKLKESNDTRINIASISQQSVASVAAEKQMTLGEAWAFIALQLKERFAVDCVFDIAFASDIALIEARKEFVERFKSKQALPVLCGECPGWICYAEKTQHHALPYISRVKSPQQILGIFVKRYVARKLNIGPENIFHFAIAPCFDKKLEAARTDEDLKSVVDMVIGTNELMEMLNSDEEIRLPERKVNREERIELTKFTYGPEFKVFRSTYFNAESGSYAEHIYRYAAKELFGVDLAVEEPLNFKVDPKNPNFQEVELVIEGKVVLRFAKAYGFRNIQNLVRKLKNVKMFGSRVYDYVEVMACPSGCLNGGAQLQASSSSSSSEALVRIRMNRDRLDRVYSLYHESSAVLLTDPELNPLLDELSSECLLTRFTPVVSSLGGGGGDSW